jgi:hypothetical protein
VTPAHSGQTGVAFPSCVGMLDGQFGRKTFAALAIFTRSVKSAKRPNLMGVAELGAYR